MAYFKIEYGCGCGTNEEHIIANSLEEAEREAYEKAVEDYHSFAGLHGVRSMEQVAEEMFGDPWSGDDYDLDTLTEEELAEVEEEFNSIIEEEISYYAVEITEGNLKVPIDFYKKIYYNIYRKIKERYFYGFR